MLKWHKNYLKWWQDKLGISSYGIAWIAFLKGLIIGFLFGTAAGFIQMYRSISRWNQNVERRKEFEQKDRINSD